MSGVDWTRIFLDAVGREADVTMPSSPCEAARRATTSCPPWQEAVFEKIDELPKIAAYDVLKMISMMARDYREAYRIHPDLTPMEVLVPRWYALKLIERHGSLNAASETIFEPGRVIIRDAEDVYAADVVTERLRHYNEIGPDEPMPSAVRFDAV